ncbi:Signal recognition particle 14 kDa protein [Linum perenne]
MFGHGTEKGYVWDTLKRCKMVQSAKEHKMASAGQPLEYRCLIRATDGKSTIPTSVRNLDFTCFTYLLKIHGLITISYY